MKGPLLPPLLLGVALTSGCLGAGDPAPGPSPASTLPPPSPQALPTDTAVPLHVTSRKIGAKYIYVTEQRKNRRVYVLRADSNTSVRLGNGDGRSDFVNPHITFYDRDGKWMIAAAPHGQARERDRSVFLSGGVKARNQAGIMMRSDTMRYDDPRQTVYGDGHVVVTFPQGQIMTGEHLQADLRLSQVHLTPDAAP